MAICVRRSRGTRSLYARTLRAVVDHRRFAVIIVVGSLMHAAGHALLAAAGGVLARALAGGASPGSGGSVTILARLGDIGAATDPLISLSLAGLFAAIVKLVGGVAAGWGEARVAGEVGAELRLDVLERLIGSGATHRVREGWR